MGDWRPYYCRHCSNFLHQARYQRSGHSADRTVLEPKHADWACFPCLFLCSSHCLLSLLDWHLLDVPWSGIHAFGYHACRWNLYPWGEVSVHQRESSWMVFLLLYPSVVASICHIGHVWISYHLPPCVRQPNIQKEKKKKKYVSYEKKEGKQLNNMGCKNTKNRKTKNKNTEETNHTLMNIPESSLSRPK